MFRAGGMDIISVPNRLRIPLALFSTSTIRKVRNARTACTFPSSRTIAAHETCRQRWPRAQPALVVAHRGLSGDRAVLLPARALISNRLHGPLHGGGRGAP